MVLSTENITPEIYYNAERINIPFLADVEFPDYPYAGNERDLREYRNKHEESTKIKYKAVDEFEWDILMPILKKHFKSEWRKYLDVQMGEKGIIIWMKGGSVMPYGKRKFLTMLPYGAEYFLDELLTILRTAINQGVTYFGEIDVKKGLYRRIKEKFPTVDCRYSVTYKTLRVRFGKLIYEINSDMSWKLVQAPTYRFSVLIDGYEGLMTMARTRLETLEKEKLTAEQTLKEILQ